MKVFGYEVGIARDVNQSTCFKSATDHIKLVHEARADRQQKGFNVDDSYVLCTHCVLLFSLKI